MKPFKRNSAAAFTLIEIMLVIIIVVALMAVLIPNLRNALSESKTGTAEMYISRLAGNLSMYELKNGNPPTTQQGLKALVEMPTSEPRPRRWNPIEDKIELDPWGMEYRYEFPGRRNPKGFDVYSSGPDRQPNTEDDIYPNSK